MILHIVVCIKYVPETTEVEFDPQTGTLIRDGVAHVINPFDEHTVEECLRLKKYGGSVKVLTMGPPPKSA